MLSNMFSFLMSCLVKSTLTVVAVGLAWNGNTSAQEKKTDETETSKSPVALISTAGFQEIFSEDFESDIANWELVDDGWKHVPSGNSKVLSLHKKASNFKPLHRSPTHIALLKDNEVADFDLNLRVQSTNEDYNHRDVCLFFGYQSPTQYYYVHLGKKTDPHCNQIFVVNHADRTKISLTTSEGTNWDDRWHSVRLLRDATTGDIQVFFDDMNTPVMTAKDKTFTRGRIGVGSFDDTANFDNLELAGKPHSPAQKESSDFEKGTEAKQNGQ